mmetsp:Transcript_69105/g.184155  ORF Transcript_69105/g.184155 Transcript_69105/m.184155 type:complete len:86 (+) Transcript_69105:905-1162(+)
MCVSGSVGVCPSVTVFTRKRFNLNTSACAFKYLRTRDRGMEDGVMVGVRSEKKMMRKPVNQAGHIPPRAVAVAPAPPRPAQYHPG